MYIFYVCIFLYIFEDNLKVMLSARSTLLCGLFCFVTLFQVSHVHFYKSLHTSFLFLFFFFFSFCCQSFI